MATLYGTEYTRWYRSNPALKINPPYGGGGVRVIAFTYVAPILALNDIVKVAKIPKGALVLEAGLKFSDLGTVGTLDLGWAASAELDSTGTAVEAAQATGLINAANCNTAADVILASQNQAAPLGVMKRFDAECDLQIKASAATDATGTISGYVIIAE